jgi:hypothetical protein
MSRRWNALRCRGWHVIHQPLQYGPSIEKPVSDGDAEKLQLECEYLPRIRLRKAGGKIAHGKRLV